MQCKPISTHTYPPIPRIKLNELRVYIPLTKRKGPFTSSNEFIIAEIFFLATQLSLVHRGRKFRDAWQFQDQGSDTRYMGLMRSADEVSSFEILY